jgi:hypothetical protein
MSEVIVQFNEAVESPSGARYIARACGRPVGHTWEGWIEFLPVGVGVAIRTERETTQSNREDLSYWASGLSGEYLESALERALEPPLATPEPEIPPPQMPPPASTPRPARHAPRAVLDPFSVYQQGEDVLRKELRALSADHLRNIIRAYELDDAQGEPPSTQTEPELVSRILTAVRRSQEVA